MLRTVTRWLFNEIFSVTLFEWKWLKTCNGKRLVSISEHLESSDFDPLVCPACFRVTLLLFRMALERVTHVANSWMPLHCAWSLVDWTNKETRPVSESSRSKYIARSEFLELRSKIPWNLMNFTKKSMQENRKIRGMNSHGCTRSQIF